MNTVHQSALLAFSEHKRLIDRHQQFSQELNKHASRTPDYGSIVAPNSVLQAKCFDVELKITHRVLAKDERFIANEYAFFGMLRGEEELIYAFYLFANGEIYSNFEKTEKICDFNNDYLPEHLVSGLASAYLKSRLVALLK